LYRPLISPLRSAQNRISLLIPDMGVESFAAHTNKGPVNKEECRLSRGKGNRDEKKAEERREVVNEKMFQMRETEEEK
jgi:hypothetical protein